MSEPVDSLLSYVADDHIYGMYLKILSPVCDSRTL